MFVVTVEFRVHRANLDAFRSAMLLQASNSLRLEAACRQFDVCFAADDPCGVFLYEVYDDAETFQQHLASEHFQTFDRQVQPWLESKTVKRWIRSEHE